MREINVAEITAAVSKLCIESCCFLPQGVRDKIQASIKTEESPLGKEILSTLVENFELAERKVVPLCQDTGLVVVFIEIGQEVHFVGGDLETAINAGVADGYINGYLRKSSVGDPIFTRKNSGDNTPGIIHTKIVPGDKVNLVVIPKGCGSENMGALKMLKPADGVEGIKKFVVDTVRSAGPNPCPPVTVGVGVGGNMELCAILAKKALARPIGEHNADPRYAELEKELLELVNKTGVGPSGLGGSTTAFAVNIEFANTHIGGMPCAVNLNCHQARRAAMTI
ncbi:MAG: fumarate hydratase [Phascolarctobacterium sp.]|nr:fumarate hydratase [Phascolarctobacterium sp.]